MQKMTYNTEEKYRSIFNCVGNVIASINDSGVIIDCNEVIQELLGFTRDEVIGKQVLNLVHPDYHWMIQNQFYNIYSHSIGDCPKYHEFKMIRKDNVIIDVCINSSAVKSENEEYIWSIWVINDITSRNAERRKIEEERNRAEVYLDLLGHDINNYNQAITSYSELLLMKPDLTEDYRKYLRTTLNQSRAITDLVSNVGKLSELKKGNYRLNRVDLFKPLATAIEHVKQIFPHRKIKINQSISESEVYIRSIDMLVDAFINIINNAVKFENNELVIIDINYSLDEDNNFLQIEFSDHGPGIPDENKKTIFKWFEIGSQPCVGSGLGLALVKEIVTKSGGYVWVEDRKAGNHTFGSKFVIQLPYES